MSKGNLMNLNALIERLSALRDEVGGETLVLISDYQGSAYYNGEFSVRRLVTEIGEVVVDIDVSETREF
jgi:hypothetical protein